MLQRKRCSGLQKDTESSDDVFFVALRGKAVTVPQPGHINRRNQGQVWVFLHQREPKIKVSPNRKQGLWLEGGAKLMGRLEKPLELQGIFNQVDGERRF